MSDVKDRALLFINYKELNNKQFEDSCGLGNGFVSKIGSTIRDSKLELISNAFPELNMNWLTKGVDDMLILKKHSATGIENEVSDVLHAGLNPNIKLDYTLVPIVHIDSVGGIHASNSIVGEPQYIEGYVPFTDAKDGDICIIQSGNSMTPTCPSGSLLLLRKVLNWREYFGFGSIFVIELSDGRRITKEVSRYDENPKDYIWCISHNPNVPDEELPKSMIVSVWKVIKIQIDKGW